ncbi:hypothetical protein C808_02538 [Lachnospiraceae bacterium M18-1]|nr:hypothetical protein C808_02538 [Lachnospiraceae bacterium M18-1]
MNEYEYTGNKTRNYFTAYLQKCIRWKRKNYLQKKEKIRDMEERLEDDLQMEYGMTVEEMAEARYKEELLLRECDKNYPEWDELSDQRLVASLLLLREEERRLIYQHVFEERSFEEMGALNGMAKERVKGVYYYAIRKIRGLMRGEK